MAVANNSGLSEAITKANTELSPELADSYQTLAENWGLNPAEYRMVMKHLRAEFGFYEDQFFTPLPNSDRDAVNAQFIGAMRGPTENEFWKMQKQFFHRDFRQHVDDLISKSGVRVGYLPGDFNERIRQT